MTIKYYAGNRWTGTNSDRTGHATGNLVAGLTFLETDTDDVYTWDGDSWNVVSGNTVAQILTNKTFTDAITFKEMSAPGDQADTYGALYIKAKASSNAVYFKADDETEFDLTESASAGSLSAMTDTTITSPGDAALLLYDTGTSKWRDADMSGIATISDVGAIALAVNAITDQSAETTPQGSSDLILMYDSSASALKKITVSNLLAGGISADTLNALNDTTIASVASAQVLIYDGTDSWDNKTVSGDVTINASGVTAIGVDKVTGTMIHANAVDDSSLEQSGTTFRVKATGVTNAMLAGSIADSKLSTIATGNKVSGSAIQLSGTSAIEDSSGLRIKTATAGAGLAISSQILSVGVDDSSIEINNDALRVKATGVTNAMLAGSITNAKLSNSSITVSDGSNTSPVALGGTLTFAATANETTVAESAGTVTIGLPSNVTIAGNLIVTGNSTVNGDTVTQNVATVLVEDPLMALASGNNSSDAVDIGFYGLYDTSGTDKYTGLFRDANDSGKWKLFKDLQAAPTTVVNTSGTGYAVGTLVADVEGNITTATALATGRTISASGDITWTSASFTGSTNVTSVAAITADVIVNADVKSDAGIAYTKLAALADGNILVGNGSNVATSVNPSGDIDVTNAGVFSIASGVIVDADVNASAAIAYSKLAALADGNILVGNGSNVATSINPSGDIDITNAGVFSISAGVIVNADVNASAAIVDTKLATIATADKVAGGAIQIDSGTDGTGITIANADKFLVDDGGTTKYVNASQISTYIGTVGDANQNAWTTITRSASGGTAAGDASVVAVSVTDSVDLVAGVNITITGNNSAKSITIAAAASGASESFAIAMAVAL